MGLSNGQSLGDVVDLHRSRQDQASLARPFTYAQCSRPAFLCFPFCRKILMVRRPTPPPKPPTRSGGIESPAYGLCENDVKAFLREMVVVAENVCKALAPHRLHRDTIGQAVFFVETVFIQS